MVRTGFEKSVVREHPIESALTDTAVVVSCVVAAPVDSYCSTVLDVPASTVVLYPKYVDASVDFWK